MEGQGLRCTGINFHIQGKMYPFTHMLIQGTFVKHVVGGKCKHSINENTFFSERYFLDF